MITIMPKEIIEIVIYFSCIGVCIGYVIGGELEWIAFKNSFRERFLS